MSEQALKNPFSSPLNIAHMLRNPPPPLDHVLPGLLVETVGLVVGPGAVSKTMLALQMAIAMATGTPLLGGLVGGAGPRSAEPARVSALVELWYLQHGSTLRAGNDTKKRLVALANAVGDPVADRFDVQMFAKYRTDRVAAGISEANCNREQAYVKAMFNELIRLGLWSKENPIAKIRPYKIPDTELSWLTLDQIANLLSELAKGRNPHALLITKVALSTGGRWGETEGLTVSQVRAGKVHFTRTKTDRNRSVPISPDLEEEVLAHHVKHGKGKRIFQYAEGAFKEAIERAGIELPHGQMTHVLRHSFASHFMMRGGNILSLQKILGHKDLKTTMRYAHLSPEHLQEAVALNPLAPVPLVA